MIQTITGVPVAPTKPIIGANAFAHESGIHQHGVMANKETYEIMTPESVGIPQNAIVLGKHSGRHAFEDRLRTLGYQLDAEKLDKAFAKFKLLADKKKLWSAQFRFPAASVTRWSTSLSTRVTPSPRPLLSVSSTVMRPSSALQHRTARSMPHSVPSTRSSAAKLFWRITP